MRYWPANQPAWTSAKPARPGIMVTATMQTGVHADKELTRGQVAAKMIAAVLSLCVLVVQPSVASAQTTPQSDADARHDAVQVPSPAGAAGGSAAMQPSAAAVAVPPRPENVIAAKAYGTLERHCSRCHQTGRLQSGDAGGAIADILDLDEIARDPSLVRPGVPDASALYNSILANRMPKDVVHGSAEGPTGEEVQALRDWIAELPVGSGPVCSGRVRLTPGAIGAAIEEAVSRVAAEKAAQLRYISLAPLYNACLADHTIEALRQGVALLVGVVGRSLVPVTLERIGPGGLILAFDLSQSGWTPAQWEVLAAGDALRLAPSARVSEAVREATHSRWPLLGADRLANAALAGRGRDILLDLAVKSGPAVSSHLLSDVARLLRSEDPQTFAAMTSLSLDPDLKVWGLSPLAALLHAYRRPLDLVRAAADFGVAPDALRFRLDAKSLNGSGKLAFAARLLSQGVARRPDVDLLLAQLTGPKSAEATTSHAVSDAKSDGAAVAPALPEGVVPAAAATAKSDDKTGVRAFEIAIWSDKESYAASDVVVLQAEATQSCYLTLISVDKDHRATVLFPNNFETDNKILPGRRVQVPGPSAGYRFRFKHKGRETVVGICSKTDKAPDGIVHDFERLRFTVLGDWQIFLRDPPLMGEARRDDAALAEPRPKRRRRGRSRGAADKAVVEDEADVQARAGVVFDVK